MAAPSRWLILLLTLAGLVYSLVSVMRHDPELLQRVEETLHELHLDNAHCEVLLAGYSQPGFRGGDNLAAAAEGMRRAAQALESAANQAPLTPEIQRSLSELQQAYAEKVAAMVALSQLVWADPRAKDQLKRIASLPLHEMSSTLYYDIEALQEQRSEQSGQALVLATLCGLMLLVYASYSQFRVARLNNLLERRVEARTRSLSDAERRLRLMSDAMPASISFIDGDERYRQTNATADAWYGRMQGSAIGKRMRDCLSEQGYAVSKPYIDRALAGEAVHFTVDSPYPNGERRLVEVHYVPLAEGGGQVSGFYSMVIDISEAQRARQQLQTVIDSLPAGIAYIDGELRFVMQNATGARWTERRPGEVIGMHIAEVYQAGTYARCTPFIQRALAGEEVEFDLALRADDPTQAGRTLHVHYVPQRDMGDGKPGFLSMMTDVSEARLRQAQLRLMMDALPAAIAYVDIAEIYRSVNATWMHWFGGELGDPIGRSLREVQGERIYSEETRRAVRRVLDGDEVERDLQVPAFGEFPMRDIHEHFVPHRDDDGVRGFFALITDVTERRRAEQALRESEERLRHVSESVDEFLWETDPDAVYRYISERCEKMRGYRPDELIGFTPYEFMLEEDRVPVRSAIAEAVAANKPFSVEHRMLRKDGSIVWERATGRPVFAEDGRYLGCRGACEDITAHKLAEGQLKLVMDSVPAAMIYIDSEQRFQQVNATWLRWFPECGLPIGKRVDEFASPERYAALRPRIEGVLAGQPQSFDSQTLINGEQRTLHVDYIPDRMHGGSVRGYFGLMTDVTEARESAHQLARQRDMLERTEALANVGSWRLVYGEKTCRMSPEACRILGIGIVEQVAVETIRRCLLKEDLTRLRKAVYTAMAENGRGQIEVCIWRGDAQLRRVLIEFTAESVGDNRKRLSGLLRDITEQHRTELLEARLRDIAAQVPGGIYQLHFDAEGQPSLPYLSPGVAQVLGHATDALQADPTKLFSIVHPDDSAKVRFATERAVREQVMFHEDMRVIHADGHESWVEAQATPSPDHEGGTLFMGYMQDVSERKALEAELALTSQRLSDAIEALPGGFMLYDADDRLVYWNSAQEQLFKPAGFRYYRGMPFEELVRHGATHEHGYGDFDSDAEREAFIAERLRQHLATRASHEMCLADGRWVSVQETRTAEGGVVGIRFDISELKQAQQDLRGHRDNLQKLVNEQTVELINAVAEAEHANQLKSEFLANMSHELRTPMHAILSFANMGNGRAEKAPRDKLAHYFLRITESGDRLLKLLNDLLDLSKLEAGRMELDVREENFRALVHTVLEEFSALLTKRSVTVHCHSDVRDVKLRCDAARILQVVRNLLSNAIKFSPADGAIDLYLELCHAVDDPRGRLVFRVIDSGPGIPEDETELVFDKFVQSSKTRTGAGGTGLGLAICREIVQLHGGVIHAGNAANRGAEFTVCLPRDGVGAARWPDCPAESGDCPRGIGTHVLRDIQVDEE